MAISREYQKYLASELYKRKPTIFETISNKIGGRIPIDIPIDKDTRHKMWQQIEFVGWKTKPENIYKAANNIAFSKFGVILSEITIYKIDINRSAVARIRVNVTA